MGRLEEPEIAMPCMGLLLDDAGLELGSPALAIEVPTLVEVAEINDRAYGNPGALRTLFPSLRDPRVQTHGLRVDGAFVVVGMTVAIGDDVSIQYVATEAKYRRRGLASRLLRGVLGEARNRGIRSATLQASPDGRPVYERLGFRRVATLRAFLRPPAGS